jgi:alkyl hydroperoxide reductase subunit F
MKGAVRLLLSSFKKPRIMLDNNLKTQVQSLFANLANNYTFKVEVADDHASKNELTGLLQDVASCSEKVSCDVKTGEGLSFVFIRTMNPLR